MTFPVRVGIIISRLGFECCWLPAGLQVKTFHFLDSTLIKNWKFWPIWLFSEFHQSRKTEGREYLHWISGRCENQCCWKKGIKDHEKRGNAQDTAEWQSDNRENMKHNKRNQSFFRVYLIGVQIFLQMQPDGVKKSRFWEKIFCILPWCRMMLSPPSFLLPEGSINSFIFMITKNKSHPSRSRWMGFCWAGNTIKVAL